MELWWQEQMGSHCSCTCRFVRKAHLCPSICYVRLRHVRHWNTKSHHVQPRMKQKEGNKNKGEGEIFLLFVYFRLIIVTADSLKRHGSSPLKFTFLGHTSVLKETCQWEENNRLTKIQNGIFCSKQYIPRNCNRTIRAQQSSLKTVSSHLN